MNLKKVLYVLPLGCLWLAAPLAQGQGRTSTGIVAFQGSVSSFDCQSEWNAAHERLQTRECHPATQTSRGHALHVRAENVFSGEPLTVVHEDSPAGCEFAFTDSQGKRVSSGSYWVTLNLP